MKKIVIALLIGLGIGLASLTFASDYFPATMVTESGLTIEIDSLGNYIYNGCAQVADEGWGAGSSINDYACNPTNYIYTSIVSYTVASVPSALLKA